MIARLTSMRSLLGLFASLLLGLSPGAWSAQDSDSALSAEQITQLIVGNTVRGAARATLFNIYYEADGKVSAVFNGRALNAETDDGTWKFKDGNTVCQEFSHLLGGVERCYQWYKAEGERYVMRNVDSYRVDNLSVWNILEGNPLGF